MYIVSGPRLLRSYTHSHSSDSRNIHRSTSDSQTYGVLHTVIQVTVAIFTDLQVTVSHTRCTTHSHSSDSRNIHRSTSDSQPYGVLHTVIQVTVAIFTDLQVTVSHTVYYTQSFK